ncbi:hypothetical protein P152DRAFT_512101 [Eremomyces bilateralis CBS 781.70]|uniref:Transcription factor domain-containing protein n=1 Tax=Eremomyces bilateralis CBS 781.70 TaxID=1392243 RepID=A0A6G1GA76_9PEZI|nr:uncharacterized protein P152DRAFT_512101 [Eremomyces bilateralis CBS 781.70]KAF1814739.1 hypothetical protein P152DRAFT_512101 [Eremomyces bilateralis CBS 781.70]
MPVVPKPQVHVAILSHPHRRNKTRDHNRRTSAIADENSPTNGQDRFPLLPDVSLADSTSPTRLPPPVASSGLAEAFFASYPNLVAPSNPSLNSSQELPDEESSPCSPSASSYSARATMLQHDQSKPDPGRNPNTPLLDLGDHSTLFNDFPGFTDYNFHNYFDLMDTNPIANPLVDSSSLVNILPTELDPSVAMVDNHCSCTHPCTTFTVSWIALCCKASLCGPTYHDVVNSQALSVPTEDVMRELINLYFVYVHPIFPVISEWNTYSLLKPLLSNGGETTSLMSLAMVNAIMFSASAKRSRESRRIPKHCSNA